MLNDNGIFVLISHIHWDKDKGFFLDSQSIYRKYYKGQEYEIGNTETNLINTNYFKLLTKSENIWEEEYIADDYINLLSTYSDHLALEKNQRGSLFSELKTLINNKYNGKILKRYKTVLEIAKTN